MFTEAVHLPTTKFCPLCGGRAVIKRDKKGFPYLRCSYCLSMIFMRTEEATVGIDVLADLIKQNMEIYIAECQRRLRNIASERELAETIKEMDAEEKLFAPKKPRTQKTAIKEGRE